MEVENVIFLLITLAAFGYFEWQFQKVMDGIRLGTELSRRDQWKERMRRMILVAFGQQKMFKRPIAAALHATVYIGFLIINVELIEIIIDGVTGQHRALGFLGVPYDILTASNEGLGFIVVGACVAMLWRRNVMGIRRFKGPEMARWPKLDANIILVTEIVLMIGLFLFNIGDIISQGGHAHHGFFPVSQPIADFIINNDVQWYDLHTASVGFWTSASEFGWWMHIIGIYLFLNYLPISKHFHIIMAFPNVYSSKLEPKGQLDNMDSITGEVKAMLNPEAAADLSDDGELPKMGAKDVMDLPWTNLMDAYTCTECGRCTDMCPANITGKKLSPRKIVMDTRDRLEEMKRNGVENTEQAEAYATETKTSLLHDFITAEELWACTTCNACTEACPVNIDHVSEIISLRRHMVLEEGSAPQELNIMLTNIQNNGAPWAMPASTRFDWADDVEMPTAKMAK